MKRFFLASLVETWRTYLPAQAQRPRLARVLRHSQADVKSAHRGTDFKLYVLKPKAEKLKNIHLFKTSQATSASETRAQKQSDERDLSLGQFTKAHIATRVWLVRMCARLAGVAVCVSAQRTKS